MDKNSPIGFFDSGMGGLSTLREAVAALPHENFLYYADAAHAPFGGRSEEEILAAAERAIGYLVARGAKSVVIACNTATGIGAGKLRERYRTDILGVEPAIKPAMADYAGGMVLSLTTEATAKSRAFNALVARYAAGKPLLICSMRRLAAEVEALWPDTDALTCRLHASLHEFLRLPIESVVLGCTHYVFVREQIAELFGGRVRLYDGNAGTVRNLARRLGAADLLSPRDARGRLEIVSTDPAKLPLYRSVMSDVIEIC